VSPPANGDDKPGALYEQVKRHIVERIQTGEWASGARVPSENELVQSLGVSRMTVHRALRELSSQGLLARVQGVGTFVAPAHAKSELLEIRDVGDDVVARGHAHSVKVVAQEAVRANPDMAQMFDLRPGAKIFHSLLVHFEDELPIQLEDRFIRPSFAPSYLEQDFTLQTPGNYLLSIAPPTELDHVVFAVLPDRRAQRLLKIGGTEPCLMLTRRTWVTAVPVSRSSFIYPGSRYSLGSRHKL
jgi:GntR family transcriptional regulator, histidine utilization repressor